MYKSKMSIPSGTHFVQMDMERGATIYNMIKNSHSYQQVFEVQTALFPTLTKFYLQITSLSRAICYSEHLKGHT